LKTITLLNRNKKDIFYLLTLLLAIGNVFGQVQQNGSLYIGDSGVVSIFTSPYNFGTSPSTTVTSRTVASYGKLYFPNATTWASASDAHHVNGYVSTFGNADFIFPIGNGTVLAPARVQNANLTASYDSAYYSADPTTVYADVDSSTLSAISSVEYWDLLGSSTANLTLTWRSSSNLSSLTASTVLEDIVIAGWNGTQWEQIPSTVDVNYLGSGPASTLTAGSITSLPISFGTYSKFTIGAKGSCSPLIASNGMIRKWNGTIWVDASDVASSTPTLENPVIIEAAYNAGSFSCNSLVLDADVTLNNNQFVEVVNGVTGASKVIMATSASFVQRANGVNAPTIKMTKTRTGLRRYDFVHFGTPITGDFFSNFATAQASTAPAANAFDLFYKYNTGVGGGWQATSATETGRGLIGRIKQADPFMNASTTDDVSVVFDGVANNGDITLSNISNNIAQPNGGTSHILLGNPYPSAIDGIKFLEENTGLDGVLYIWTSATSYPGSGLYNQADYIAYTKAGVVIPTSVPTTFDGNIPSGQAFKVKILPDVTNPTTVTTTVDVNFNNCMRLTANNSTFYKMNNQNLVEEKDRFKLNMTGANGVFSQILVAYLPEATLGYDRMYDAGRNSTSTAQLYSVFETDGRKLAINARPTFTNTDVVPVGISKNNTNTENFVISIIEKEGVFNTPNVHVYLHDKVANTYHDLSLGDFTFSSNQNLLNDRFEIVYQTTVLSNTQFESPEATVVLNNNTLSINAANAISSVQVYDLAGRLLENYSDIDAVTFSRNFNHEESVYIANIVFTDGITLSKKLIHSKN
jgi:hypothetical protein